MTEIEEVKRYKVHDTYFDTLEEAEYFKKNVLPEILNQKNIDELEDLISNCLNKFSSHDEFDFDYSYDDEINIQKSILNIDRLNNYLDMLKKELLIKSKRFNN